MTRDELIDKCTFALNRLPRLQVEVAIKSILEQMSQTLGNHERIEIRGFGSFEIKFQQERIVRNPRTGELLPGGGKHYPHFRPGKELRERVNGGQYDKITY